MYYRITKLFWDASRKEEIMAKMESLRDDLKTLNAHSITEVEVGEGVSITVGVYNSKEDADKAIPRVQEIMSDFGEFMTAPPEPHEGEVLFQL